MANFLPPVVSASPERTAVVIGAGIGGLLSARVLAGYFDAVVIVERDVSYPHEPSSLESMEGRDGLPQAGHQHTLLADGWNRLRTWFPELPALFESARVPVYDISAGVKTVYRQFAMPRALPANVQSVSVTRPFLEATLRRLVCRDCKIVIVPGVRAVGLRHEGQAVRGVRVGRVGCEAEADIAAGLVVCAAGSAAPAGLWLEQLGYPKPRTITVRSDLFYASQFYAVERKDVDWVQCAALVSEGQAGMMSFSEHGRAQVTASCAGRRATLPDEAGLRAFFGRTGEELLNGARAVTPYQRWSHVQSRYTRFDEMAAWPDGFVVLGDAVCCVNPILGMGMSLAMRGVKVLEEVLSGAPEAAVAPGVSAQFQRRLPDVLTEPWWLAMAHDHANHGEHAIRLGWPDTAGIELYRRFLRRINAAPELAPIRAQVHHLCRPLGELFELVCG